MKSHRKNIFNFCENDTHDLWFIYIFNFEGIDVNIYKTQKKNNENI